MHKPRAEHTPRRKFFFVVQNTSLISEEPLETRNLHMLTLEQCREICQAWVETPANIFLAVKAVLNLGCHPFPDHVGDQAVWGHVEGKAGLRLKGTDFPWVRQAFIAFVKLSHASQKSQKSGEHVLLSHSPREHNVVCGFTRAAHREANCHLIYLPQ